MVAGPVVPFAPMTAGAGGRCGSGSLRTTPARGAAATGSAARGDGLRACRPVTAYAIAIARTDVIATPAANAAARCLTHWDGEKRETVRSSPAAAALTISGVMRLVRAE